MSNIVESKVEVMSQLGKHLRQARKSLKKGDTEAAGQQLRLVFYDLNLAQSKKDLTTALTIFRECLTRSNHATDQELYAASTTDANDIQGLYDFAVMLGLNGHFRFAACIALRLRTLYRPDRKVSEMLIHFLVQEFRFEDALNWARADCPQFRECYYLQYLFGFSALMCAHLDEAYSACRFMQEAVTADEEDMQLMHAFQGMLCRVKEIECATSLSMQDLRGWHYVITGGLLLDTSPPDHDMNGRYSILINEDIYSFLRLGLERLKIATELLQIRSSRILLPAEPGSRALGLAAAQVLDWPVETWDGAIQEGMVVAVNPYDLDETGSKTLSEHHSGQLFYCHSECWTRPSSFTPDFLTSLVQAYSAPWGDFYSEGEVIRKFADAHDSSTEDLAYKISNADFEDDSAHQLQDVAEIKRVATAIGDYAAFRLTSGKRLMSYPGPVASSEFIV